MRTGLLKFERQRKHWDAIIEFNFLRYSVEDVKDQLLCFCSIQYHECLPVPQLSLI
jgi:hypothetical protein